VVSSLVVKVNGVVGLINLVWNRTVGWYHEKGIENVLEQNMSEALSYYRRAADLEPAPYGDILFMVFSFQIHLHSLWEYIARAAESWLKLSPFVV